MAGRKSRLNDADFCKAIAEAYVSGMSREDMADELDCHRDTIPKWVSDPRVQAEASKLTLERINRISRRVDSVIEGRMARAEQMTVKELLEIRKEYLSRSMKLNSEGAATAETTNELAEAMDQNPDLAAALRALVGDK